MVIIIVNSAIQVQILSEAVCILHNTNILEKGMNSTIFSLAMGK